jgi:hypothetical protein
MKQYVAALLCAALAFSCAASLPYASDYPLTEQTFRSRDGSFSGKVPRGWFASSGDTVVPAVVAWLVRDDLSAAMGVRELNLDRLSGERVGKDGVQLLARISAGLHEGGAGTSTVVSGAREFELRGKKFCGYEIASGGKRSRVVVF